MRPFSVFSACFFFPADDVIRAGHVTGVQTCALPISSRAARSRTRDPAVLVLDEATADEGSSGARVLERAALEVARGRTAVIVAHRLSQARLADRIDRTSVVSGEMRTHGGRSRSVAGV